MLIAVQVKYLGPTNTKGSRYRARSKGNGSLTVAKDYSMSCEDNARYAAHCLLEKLRWPYTPSAPAWLPNGDYIFTAGR